MTQPNPETRDRRAETFTRALTLERASVDRTARTVQAALSSELEVERWFGREVLSHEPGAVDLARAADGLPLLWNHDSDRPIGIVENVRLADDRKLRGVLRFSRNPKAEEAFQDVQDGLLRNLSIGYHIKEWTETADSDLVRVTKWELLEASIAPVPADPTVGIQRQSGPGGDPPSLVLHVPPPSRNPAVAQSIATAVSEIMDTIGYRAMREQALRDLEMFKESERLKQHITDILSPPRSTEASMSTTENVPAGVAAPTPQPVTAAPTVDLPQVRRELDITRQAARREGAQDERRRVEEIYEVFEMASVPRSVEMIALREFAVKNDWTADQAGRAVLAALATPAPDAPRTVSDEQLGIRHQAPVQPRATPIAPTARASDSAPSVQAGEDALDKFRDAASHALLVRSNIVQDTASVRIAAESGLAGMNLARLADHYLQLLNISTRGMSDEQLAGRAFTARAAGMTTSDFASLLGNTANKAMLKGWEETPETWRAWARIGTLPDFKPADRVGLGSFTSLDKITSDGEIKYGKLGDRKEYIALEEYAKKFRLSRRTIINDDLNAFSRVPYLMGQAAQRKIGDVVYALFDGTGPTLNQDGTALFDTSAHKNYTASAAAPSVSTLDTAFQAIRRQKDPTAGAVLNIVPRFLIVPTTLEVTAQVLVDSQYDPGATSSTKNMMTPNPFKGRLTVISDARLDDQTNGTAAWYLAADPNIFDTVEVAFLNGIAQPRLQEQEEWDTQGVEYVVGIDFGVAVLDFRGLFKQKGAT